MKLKRLLALWLSVIMLCTFTAPICKADTQAESGEQIRLYIDNVEQELKTPCVTDNGIVYIPAQEVFFKLGVYLEWDEKNGYYYGEGNNGEIRLTLGSITADIDWVPVELPGPIKNIDGVLMVPLYLVEDAVRTEPAVYDEATQSIYIKFPDINYKAPEIFRIETVLDDLPEGRDLFREEQLYDLMYDNGKDYIKYDVVDIEGMHFNKAVQLETLSMGTGRIPEASYSIQMHTIIDGGDFESGDVGLMTFWARATKITDESGKARMRPCYEQLYKWQKAQESEVVIGDEWQKYYLPLYSAPHTLKSGESHLTFSVGFKPQIVQFADVHLYNYDDAVDIELFRPNINEPYKGMEDDHLWRKEAYKRIEKYRKNDMLIRVQDENGNPIKDAEISVDMTENEYMFGLAICDWEILDLNEGNSRTGDIRSYVIDELSNTGICGLEMKWEGLSDKYMQGRRMVNDWLSRGKRMRGHALAWDERSCSYIPGYPNLPMEDMYNHMVNEAIAEAWMFKGTMTQWDALNEPHDSNKWRNKYGTQVFSEIFQNTKAIDPKAKLYINETGMEGHDNRNEATRAHAFVRIAQNMIENERAPVDGLGIQGHCTRYIYPMGFYHDIDILSQLVDEVAVTEYDFYNTDYTYAPYHLRDTFLATFSHPKTTAFVVWGYFDPWHWRNYGPFYDRSWNPKPEMEVWDRMINEEFATHTTAVTDENGEAIVRGFRGQYEIKAVVNGVEAVAEFTLANSDNIERDNYITFTLKNGKLISDVSNPHEKYGKDYVEYQDYAEAYTDYLAATADGKLVGIYKHKDQSGNTVPKTNDGLMNTFWYGENDGDYVHYELVEEATNGDISVDFRAVNDEVYNYKVYTSMDNENWSCIYEGKSTDNAVIPFENAMYVKIESVGNEYMGISEVNINAKKK